MKQRIYAWACLCGFQTDTEALEPVPKCRDCKAAMHAWLSRHSARSGVTAADIEGFTFR
ncbi:hypothetical protein [Sphingomonas sp.]|uniref:hypothetical protein n=1 Tax=Sphingomonas sp. TaxID=28214 RepID=UPI003BAD3874